MLCGLAKDWMILLYIIGIFYHPHAKLLVDPIKFIALQVIKKTILNNLKLVGMFFKSAFRFFNIIFQGFWLLFNVKKKLNEQYMKSLPPSLEDFFEGYQFLLQPKSYGNTKRNPDRASSLFPWGHIG